MKLVLTCFYLGCFASIISSWKQPFQSRRFSRIKKESDLTIIEPVEKQFTSQQNVVVRWKSIMRGTLAGLFLACTGDSSDPTTLFSNSVQVAHAVEAAKVVDGVLVLPKSPRPYAYSIEMVTPPSLLPRSHPSGETSLLQRLSKSNIVLFGEHLISPPNDLQVLQEDRVLEVDLLKRMSAQNSRRSLVLYLQALPRTAAVNSAVQEYISRSDVSWEIFEKKIRDVEGVKIEKLSSLKPLLEFAKSRPNSMEIQPVGLPPAIFDRVAKQGLDGLTDNEKQNLIKRAEVYVSLSEEKGFPGYAEDVLTDLFQQEVLNNRPELTINEKMPEKDKILRENQVGSLRTNYFSAKMLEDHFMASILSDTIEDISTLGNNNAPLVVGIVDGQDVVFGFGVEERLKRIIAADVSTVEAPVSATSDIVKNNIYSVMLNPTAQDSHSHIASLGLVLRYGHLAKYQYPLADFIWFSDYPAVNLLTRPKNAIDREGQRPPGESSILGAF